MCLTFEIFSTLSGCEDGRTEGAGEVDLTQNVTALNENLSSPSLPGLVQTFHSEAKYLNNKNK